MGRPERDIDPNGGPLQRFAIELRELRKGAGRPSYRLLARRAHYSVTALSEAAGGETMPSLAVTLAYVRACGGDDAAWELRWRAVAAELGMLEPGPEPADADELPPYLGLSTFGPADAGRFFGRERVVDELRGWVRDRPVVALFAPSGAGKSSVLRAGLLPAVEADEPQWSTVMMTPGGRPTEELAVHLANAARIPAGSAHDSLTADPAGARLLVRQILAGRPQARLLLVVDQFEEIFTLCPDDRDRARFVDAVLGVAAESQARVVIGARADFYGHCATYPALIEAFRDGQMLLGPPDDDELRRVVTGPAGLAGLSVEPGLVELVVAETRGQPGSLALLSHALLETWRRREGRVLTVAGYRATGGVAGAIAATAERVHETFSPAERDLARDVFLRLTAFGEGTEDTRRPAALAELGDPARVGTLAVVLDRLTAARLIVTDETSVTVAHEALIRGWPRLRGWLAEDRELLRAHRRLTETALEWDRHGREDGLLPRGTPLSFWEGRDLGRLNELERECLLTARRRCAREQGAARRRLRRLVAGLVATVVVVSAAAAVAVGQAVRADAQGDLARARQLTAEARHQSQVDPERALRLARDAFATRAVPEAEMVLRQAVADQRSLARIPVGSAQALGVTFSPDRRRLAVAAVDGTVRIWTRDGDGVTDDPVILPTDGHQAWTPVFSADGARLAAASLGGTVRVWNLADPTAPERELRGHAGRVWATAFDPTGARLASAGQDGTVRIWDARGNGAPVILGGPGTPLHAVAFSPDGRRVAAAGSGGTVHLWDPATAATTAMLPGNGREIKDVAFTPDGGSIVGAGVDGTGRVWSLTGSHAPALLRGHQGTVESVAVSPDGRYVATGSDDMTVRVWSVTGEGEPQVLRGHTGTVWALAFTSDGSRLASAAGDGTVRLWDPRGVGEPEFLTGHTGAAYEVVRDPAGRRIVTGGDDGTVRVWDLTGTAPPRVLDGGDRPVYGVAASASHVAAASGDGRVRIWDPADPTHPTVLSGHVDAVWSVDLSPDGRLLTSAGTDGTLRIWDLRGGREPLVRAADPDFLRFARFSPDSTSVATGGRDGSVRIWDTTGVRPPVVHSGHDGLVWSVAFSPDGRRVASAGADGTIRIWSATDPDARPLVLRGHQGFVWYLTFSPDGTWIASTGKDSTVRVWQTARAGEPITFRGFDSPANGVTFDPDSRHLSTAHDDGTVRRWRCVACGPVDSLR